MLNTGRYRALIVFLIFCFYIIESTCNLQRLFTKISGNDIIITNNLIIPIPDSSLRVNNNSDSHHIIVERHLCHLIIVERHLYYLYYLHNYYVLLSVCGCPINPCLYDLHICFVAGFCKYCKPPHFG